MPYYYKHPDLIIPDDSSCIWRYMDFSKFESILQNNSLFFSRADKQTDKFEGEYPIGMLDELQRQWESQPSDDGTSYTFIRWHTQREIPSRLLSCWSLDILESRKKWCEYTKTVESVAICSTIGKLKNCFQREECDEKVIWIGKIRYGEGENKLPKSFHKWKVNYFLYPFFAKKEAYRWENEIRATVNIAQKKQLSLNCTSNGCLIKTDVHTLIESVWVHPQATECFRFRVESLLADYGYKDIPTSQSSWSSIMD